MAQDIKKMFQEHKEEAPKLPLGHETRFEQKLKNIFSEKKINKRGIIAPWLRVAAIAVLVVGVGFFGYQKLLGPTDEGFKYPSESIVDVSPKNIETKEVPQLTLGDLSPDLKKVEEYYMSGINVQLASLKINKENKELVAGYMGRLAELDKEYNELNAELSKVGPTESTITALIDNLKLRLDLLFKLKNKLNEFKNQENEKFNSIQS